MRSKSYQQFAIIQSDSAQLLTEQLNEKLKELHDKNPIVTFEGLIARISYTVEYQTPESVAEEYEVQGLRLTCEDCPYFMPMIKSDGSEDRRAKRGTCPYKEYNIAFKDSSACDKLFQMLAEGRIGLCLKD